MATPVIDDIPALIRVIDGLPNEARAARLRELERLMSLETDVRDVAIGLLALDLVTLELPT